MPENQHQNQCPNRCMNQCVWLPLMSSKVSWNLRYKCEYTFVTQCEAASHKLWMSLWVLNNIFSLPKEHQWHNLMRWSVCSLFSPTSRMISAISNSRCDLNGHQGCLSGRGIEVAVGRCSKVPNLCILV
jgi:hypothetical protein